MQIMKGMYILILFIAHIVSYGVATYLVPLFNSKYKSLYNFFLYNYNGNILNIFEWWILSVCWNVVATFSYYI